MTPLPQTEASGFQSLRESLVAHLSAALGAAGVAVSVLDGPLRPIAHGTGAVVAVDLDEAAPLPTSLGAQDWRSVFRVAAAARATSAAAARRSVDALLVRLHPALASFSPSSCAVMDVRVHGLQWLASAEDANYAACVCELHITHRTPFEYSHQD